MIRLLMPETKHRVAALAAVAVLVGAATAQIREGNLRPGDLAPDFELKVRGENGTIHLSDYRGQKPVALVFGSFT